MPSITNLTKTISWVLGAFCLGLPVFLGRPAIAANLVVAANETIEMAGDYVFDNVTIEGKVLISGNTSIVVNGDLTVNREHGDPYDTSPTSFSSASENGENGGDGTNGSSPGQDGSPGGHGTDGSDGYSLSITVYGKAFWNGWVVLDAGSGGNGGKGGRGAPGQEPLCDPSGGQDGIPAGNGARGGNGGNGGNAGHFRFFCYGTLTLYSGMGRGMTVKTIPGQGGNGGEGGWGDNGLAGCPAGTTAGGWSAHSAVPPSNPGAGGEGGNAGRAGTTHIYASTVEFKKPGPSASDPVLFLGAEGGDGGDGGEGKGGGNGAGLEGDLYVGCVEGTPATAGAPGAQGGAGSSGGSVVAHVACQLPKITANVSGGEPGMPGSAGSAGGQGGGGTYDGCQQPLDGLDGRAGLVGSDGCSGGTIRITAGNLVDPSGVLESLGSRGAEGGAGGKAGRGSCVREEDNSCVEIWGAPSPGGKGGQGGSGGTIDLCYSTTSSKNPVARVSGGAGGEGGGGGDSGIWNGDYYEKWEGPDGADGMKGADGTVKTATHTSPFSLITAVDKTEASVDDLVEYSFSAAAINTSHSNVRIRLRIPEHTSVVRYSSGGTVDGDTIYWDIAELPVCRLHVYTLTVAVLSSANAGDILENYGSVSSKQHPAVINSDKVQTEIVVPFNPLVRTGFRLGDYNGPNDSPDPVNPATGNYYFRKRLFNLPGRSLPIDFRVTYNSMDTNYEGPLGPGWTHSYNIYLKEDTVQKEIAIKWGDGHEEYWSTSGGAYTAFECYTDITIANRNGGGWLARQTNGTVYEFDPSGELLSIKDGAGNTVSLTHSSGKLTKMIDTSGRQINFSYTNDVITKVSLTGLSVSISYNADGELSGLGDPRGNAFGFTYDNLHRLTELHDRKGVKVLTQTYDSFGRVATQTDVLGRVTGYDYPAEGRAIITPPSGHAVSHIYNGAYSAVRVTDATGSAACFTYDARMRCTKVNDKRGGQIRQEFDDQGNLKVRTERNGGKIQMAYNALHHPTTVTDPLGHNTALQYDNKGNLTGLTDPAGHSLSLANNSQGQVTSLTDKKGGVWTMTYNAQGLLASKKDPGGQTTVYTYDTLGRLVRTDYPDGTNEQRQWDANGNLTKFTDRGGRLSNATYDANDRLTKLTNPATGASVSYSYDDAGRCTSITHPDGGITRYVYDADSNLISTTDPDGVAVTRTYDAGNRLIKITDGLGRATSFIYDKNGNRTATIDPEGHRWSYDYNGSNELTRQTDPLGNQSSFSYDLAGRITQRTSPGGLLWRSGYDSMGRLTTQTLPNGKTVTYAYDANGNLAKVTDPAGRPTTLTHDARGLVTGRTDALGHKETFAYDAAARCISHTDRNGKAFTYQYTSAGQVSRVGMPGGQNIEYTYDAAGQIIQVHYGAVETAAVFDVAGRRTAFTNPDGLSMSYAYTKGGRLKSLTYPGNKRVDYTYNAAGQLAQVQDWLGNTTRITYNSSGRLSGVAYPNGLRAELAYDSAGRPTGLSYRKGSGDLLLGWGLTRDALGRISEEKDLTDAIVPPSAGWQSASYDAANRLLTLNNDAGITLRYTFDANGNLTRKEGGGAAVSYTYDVVNRLTRAAASDSTTTYRYDGGGTLYARQSAGQTTGYLRSGKALYATYDGNQNITRYFVSIGTLVYSLDPGGRMQVYLGDVRGSVAAVCDGTGAVLHANHYTPYGMPLSGQGGSVSELGFLGLHGAITQPDGLCQLGCRFYDPSLCRFLSEDPLGRTAGINLYAYAGSDPINLVDSQGLAPTPPVPIDPMEFVEEGWRIMWDLTNANTTTRKAGVDKLLAARNAYSDKTATMSCKGWQPSAASNAEAELAMSGAETSAVGNIYKAESSYLKNLTGRGVNYYPPEGYLTQKYWMTDVEAWAYRNGVKVTKLPGWLFDIKAGYVEMESFVVEELSYVINPKTAQNIVYRYIPKATRTVTWVGGRLLVVYVLYDTAKQGREAGNHFANTVLFIDPETGRAMTFEEYYSEAYTDVINWMFYPAGGKQWSYLDAKGASDQELTETQDWLNRLRLEGSKTE